MQARRLAKRSSMGSRRLSAGPAAAQADGARPPKPESAWRPPRREGSAAAVEEEDEDEDVVVEVEEEEEEEEGGLGSPPPALSAHGKGPLRASLKVRPGGPGRSARSPLPAGGRAVGGGGGRGAGRARAPGRDAAGAAPPPASGAQQVPHKAAAVRGLPERGRKGDGVRASLGGNAAGGRRRRGLSPAVCCAAPGGGLPPRVWAARCAALGVGAGWDFGRGITKSWAGRRAAQAPFTAGPGVRGRAVWGAPC